MRAVRFRKLWFSAMWCMYGVSRHGAILLWSLSLRDYLHELLKRNPWPFLLSVLCRPRLYSALFCELGSALFTRFCGITDCSVWFVSQVLFIDSVQISLRLNVGLTLSWAFTFFNPSAWGHLNPNSYCDVGRLFYGVFKLWSKLQRKKWRNNF